MCQINLMHRIVQCRAEFHKILPCTIPPCTLNLSDTPNLLAYMQIRKCHFFTVIYAQGMEQRHVKSRHRTMETIASSPGYLGMRLSRLALYNIPKKQQNKRSVVEFINGSI